MLLSGLLTRENVRRQCEILLSIGNYTAVCDGIAEVRIAQSLATQVVECELVKYPNRLEWVSKQQDMYLTVYFINRCYLINSWQQGERFSLQPLQFLSPKEINNSKYKIVFVRNLLPAMNIFYLVLYDMEGHYVAGFQMVWHS